MHKFTRPLIVGVTIALLATSSFAFAAEGNDTHRNRMLAMVANTITVMQQTLAMLEQTLLDLRTQMAGVASSNVSGTSSASAEALTFKLLALEKAYNKSGNTTTSEKATRANLLKQLTSVATERNHALRNLIAADPSAARNIMLPAALSKNLPTEVQSSVEGEIILEGTLDVLYEDYEDTSILRHFMKTSKNERFELWFANALPDDLQSGTKIKAKGLLLKNPTPKNTVGDLVVAQEGDLTLADGGQASGQTAFDLPNTLGAQRTLAILVNFQDQPTNQPWTVSDVNTMMFTTVSDFFRENSLQQTWLTGAVAGWYTIALDSTVCDGFGIQSMANAAAQAEGYVLSNYDRFVYIFPPNACGFTGMGQVGAWPSAAWINGSMILRTIGHEMGHNLGLHHAHAKDCGNTTLPVGTSTCTTQEYGDTVDIMGYTGTVGHFNTFGKDRLGWLALGNLLDVTTNGTFALAPNALETTNLKTLKIARGLDVNGDANYYYVEYRQPIGFDTQIIDRGVINPNNIFSGVLIRQASPENVNSSYLFDMTPGSNFVDMKDAALVVGQTFNDPDFGITLSTLSTTTSAASVSVTLVPPVCTRANPTITLTPASQWGDAGQGLTYSVTVTNNDNAACTSSLFSVTPTLPSGWTQTPTSLSMTLAPGANSAQSVVVTSPAGAAGGSYSFSELATNTASPTYTGSVSGIYNVNTPVVDTTPPVTAITYPADGAIIAKRAVVTLTASASDDVGVTRVEFWVKNVLKCTDTTAPYSCVWTAPNKAGAQTIQSKAFDAAGNMGVSPVITVTVQ